VSGRGSRGRVCGYGCAGQKEKDISQFGEEMREGKRWMGKE
jgi:hypothetical protein